MSGNALFYVEDSSIIGKSKPGHTNSFLCTNNIYKDFILEFDFLSSNDNSGVQFRSHKEKWYYGGRIYGLQYEIDPSDRSWSGGLYYEPKGGWLYDLSANEEACAAYNKDKWNHGRILANGPHIITWINEVECSHIITNDTNAGFIALQVHLTNTDGLITKWKTIRICEISEDYCEYYSNLKITVNNVSVEHKSKLFMFPNILYFFIGLKTKLNQSFSAHRYNDYKK